MRRIAMTGPNVDYACPCCGEEDIEAEIEGTAYFNTKIQRMKVDNYDIKQWYCLQCEHHFDEPIEVPYP